MKKKIIKLLKTDILIRSKRKMFFIFSFLLILNFGLTYFIDESFIESSDYYLNTFYSISFLIRSVVLGVIVIEFLDNDLKSNVFATYISYGYSRLSILCCKLIEIVLVYIIYLFFEIIAFLLMFWVAKVDISVANVLFTNLLSMIWAITTIAELILIDITFRVSELTLGFSITFNFIITMLPQSLVEYIPNSYFNMLLFYELFSLKKFAIVLTGILAFAIIIYIITIYMFKKIEV